MVLIVSFLPLGVLNSRLLVRLFIPEIEKKSQNFHGNSTEISSDSPPVLHVFWLFEYHRKTEIQCERTFVFSN
uniref:Secreted protein n=1 Tax=Caenorhabditis tropicalis TaxID=1561998 RepID=A0A1I7UDF8_9PELO